MSLALAAASDCAELAAVHVQAWRESYSGLVPEAEIAKRDTTMRERQWQDIVAQGGRIWLARREGILVGFGTAGPQQESELPWPGEFRAIYILRTAQRTGIGRQLMRAMASDLASAELAPANLWVLTANIGARRFYEALGGRQDFSRTTPTGDETAYVWNTLDALID